MEKMIEKMISSVNNNENGHEEEEDIMLPGFRFHPTDEELVDFYLRRKVEKKNFTIDLIKHVDIYKYDPWDLPKVSKISSVTEKEWYFFCRRGRKYRNSIRPNRVTGSGFWKATGIDKPIHSSAGFRGCIGLKKSLVYYKGSAGKGTKTDWMMHEFRLPLNQVPSLSNIKKDNLLEAEVWTLCRIFKRDISCRKFAGSDWQNKKNNNNNNNNQLSKQNITTTTTTSSRTCSSTIESDDNKQIERKLFMNDEFHEAWNNNNNNNNNNNQLFAGTIHQVLPSNYLSFSNPNSGDEYYLGQQNWDELRPVVDYASAASMVYSDW